MQDRIRDLTWEYRLFDAECSRQADKMRSNREFEKQIFIPTPSTKKEQDKKLNDLLAKAESLPAPDPVYALLQVHFSEFLKSQRSVLEMSSNRPGLAISQLTRFIDFTTRKDSRGCDERYELLTTRISQVDYLWSGIRQLLLQAEQSSLKELVDACKTLGRVLTVTDGNLSHHFSELSSKRLREISTGLKQLSAKSQQWAEEVSMLLHEHTQNSISGDDDIIKLDEDYYRRILGEELGVNLEELLSWHEVEVEKTRNEVFELASKINLGARKTPTSMAEVVNVLNTYAGPCDTVEEMFTRGRAYIDRAKIAAKEYVNLPSEYCQLAGVPEQIRYSFPWGGYGGGCPRRRPLVGETFLNDTNYKAVTDGWLKMMAIHEDYPGHHVQFIRTTVDPLPETIKIGARSVPIIEGSAHRSERVFEFVFPEDPFYPLFVAYRRHHTATRIKADLYLRYFGRPKNDAIQLYMDELGFDRGTSLGQVKAQELMLGYFNCYYYGLKRLLDLEQQYGYDEKEYTELLFSAGRVSLTTFERFLALSENDKKRYLKGFPSLMPYC